MFAHQVIDDMHKMMPLVRDEYRGFYRAEIESIKQSHHFHFDIEANIDTFKRFQDKRVFLDVLGDGIRLPYKICWFDYFRTIEGMAQKQRRGWLLVEITDKPYLFMASFFCDHPYADPTIWDRRSFTYFISPNSDNPNLPDGAFVFNEFSDSVVIKNGAVSAVPTPICVKDEDYFKKVLLEDNEDVGILNMMLLLLSCKNIGTEQHDPPLRLNRKRQKSGKQPLFTYHTLVLKPVGKRQESIPKHLWENRIHLQRGHFKTYTAEKPLFGHITGRFWWQPHVRGRNKEGIVMKDYVVESVA